MHHLHEYFVGRSKSQGHLASKGQSRKGRRAMNTGLLQPPTLEADLNIKVRRGKVLIIL